MTVFRLKHCVHQFGSTPKLVTTFHWKHNQSYTLAVKSNQIALEVRPESVDDTWTESKLRANFTQFLSELKILHNRPVRLQLEVNKYTFTARESF